MQSTMQGLSFTQRVAEMFALTGHRMEAGRVLGSHEFDFYGEFVLGATKFRFVVECKNSESPVRNADIQQFASKAALLKSRGQIDKAILVSNAPFSASARSAAAQYGIECLDINELSRSIVDFSAYLTWLTDSAEAGTLWDEFVDPHLIASHGVAASALATLWAWLAEKESSNLVLAGPAGAGKTVLCRAFARKVALAHKTDPLNTRVPIYIDLREFDYASNIRQVIMDLLVSEHGVHIAGYAAFDHMLRQGRIVLIVDGIDEVGSAGDIGSAIRILEEVAKLSVPSGKLILAGRREFFDRLIEERAFFPTAGGGRLLNAWSGIQFDEVALAPWSVELIRQYLVRALGTHLGDALDISEISKTLYQWELSRPVILKVLAEFGHHSGHLRANPGWILQYYVDYLLERDIKRAGGLVAPSEYRDIIREIAWYLLVRDQNSFHTGEVLDAIGIVIRNCDPEGLYPIAHMLLAGSFFTRINRDEYSFAHGSLLEYLAAEKVVFLSGPGAWADRTSLPSMVRKLVADLQGGETT